MTSKQLSTNFLTSLFRVTLCCIHCHTNILSTKQACPCNSQFPLSCWSSHRVHLSGNTCWLQVAYTSCCSHMKSPFLKLLLTCHRGQSSVLHHMFYTILRLVTLSIRGEMSFALHKLERFGLPMQLSYLGGSVGRVSARLARKTLPVRIPPEALQLIFSLEKKGVVSGHGCSLSLWMSLHVYAAVYKTNLPARFCLMLCTSTFSHPTCETNKLILHTFHLPVTSLTL